MRQRLLSLKQSLSLIFDNKPVVKCRSKSLKVLLKSNFGNFGPEGLKALSGKGTSIN
jgi:hypothetical protein